MVTPDTPVVGVGPRITNVKFGEVLLSASSPALVDSYQIYDAIVRERVDPAFLLAIFGHESAFGKVGLAVANNSPGNTRSSILGNGTVVDTPKGKFVQYPNWFEGFKDLAARLVEPDYVYGRGHYTTIGQIIPVFAPAWDGNDTNGYIDAVVKFMNSWIGSSSMTTIPGNTDIGFPVRVHWAFDTGPARPLGNVNTFVVHDTEGGMASDEQVLTANDGNIASAHALVAPDGTLVYMVPLDTTAWTPGNDLVAERSINIEISGFQSKGYTDAQYRSVAAFFNWCIAQGCPIPATYVGKSGTAGIIGHQDVPNPNQPGKWGGISGHTDPGPLFDWGKLTNYIREGSKINVNTNQGPANPPNIPPGPKPEFDPNPAKLTVGFGMYQFALSRTLRFVTNEQWFDPSPGQPGLSKMSRAWVQDGTGKTFILIASEQPELAVNGITPWKIELCEPRP